MSAENTNTQTDENVTELPPEVAPEPQSLPSIDRGTFVLEQRKMDKTFKDSKTAQEIARSYTFWTIVPKTDTDDEVKASLEYATKQYGPKLLVENFYSALTANIRAKANNAVKKSDNWDEQVKYADEATKTDLVTPEDAEKYVPGDREITAQSLTNKVVRLLKEGKQVEAMQLMATAQQLLATELQKKAAELEATQAPTA